MRNELNQEQLQQLIDVTLPLGIVLRIAGEQTSGGRLNELRSDRPNIGAEGLHGIYAGNARGYDGEPDGILEALDEAPEPLTWDEANKWAESIGGRLPARKEQALLFANVPELFKQEAYWSSMPYAGDDAYAWYQNFNDGNQHDHHKSAKLRARAVRRIPIQ